MGSQRRGARRSLPMLRLLVALSLLPSLATGCARAESSPPAAGPAVEIVFLDVGQGDAVLVRSPEGRTALVDAGESSPTDDLEALGVQQIDLLVATHPHADHIGGMEDVIARFPVRFYMDNGQPHTTATYRGLLETLERRDDITYLEAEPRRLGLGSAELEVLPLPPPDSVDHNNRSVALVLRYGDFVALLSGDSEALELEWLADHGALPDVTLLKAAHHGAANGFTPRFLRTVRPEVVVISVGRNSYGHPRPEALAAYAEAGATVYRTDLDGRVTVRAFRDGRYQVVEER